MVVSSPNPPSSSLSLSTSIVTVAVTSRSVCTRDNEAASQFRDVWIPHCFPHRFHRDGAITVRALNGPGTSPSALWPGATWHTRRRISSRKVRGAARRGVSNVITLDSCLLCSSTTKSYSALTSKAKLPSGPRLPSFPRIRPVPRTFFLFFYVVTTFGQRTLTKVDEKGGDSGRRRTGNDVGRKGERWRRGRTKTKIK